MRSPRPDADAVAAHLRNAGCVFADDEARLLLAEHEAGFKVVHTMLALVSIGLAVLLQRADRVAGHGVSVDDR